MMNLFIFIPIYIQQGVKAMATYPWELAQDAVCQSHTGRLTGFWFLLNRPKGWILMNEYPTRCNFTHFIYIWKLLYIFRVVPPPNIRSAYNFIYSIWYLSDRNCYLPLAETALHVSSGTSTQHQERIQLYLQHLVFVRPGAVTVWQIPDAVDKVVCAPDFGWRYHSKHVEQFPDINKMCKVASCWICIGIYLRCTDP